MENLRLYNDHIQRVKVQRDYYRTQVEESKIQYIALSEEKKQRIHHYSPAAIIRNAKIWSIILLLAFFRNLSSNLDLEYPAVSGENCLKNLLSLP